MPGPKTTGCTCFQGYRGMDRCARCDGTGSRFIVAVNGEPFYFPNTRAGYVAACAKLGIKPEPAS